MKEENDTPGINATRFFMVFKKEWFDQINTNMITVEPKGDTWEYSGTIEELQEMIKKAQELGYDTTNLKIILTDNQQVK